MIPSGTRLRLTDEAAAAMPDLVARGRMTCDTDMGAGVIRVVWERYPGATYLKHSDVEELP